jgi:hypothetical protein
MGFLEGMPINLDGVRVLVIYSDGTSGIVTDIRNFTISPSVYTLDTRTIITDANPPGMDEINAMNVGANHVRRVMPWTLATATVSGRTFASTQLDGVGSTFGSTTRGPGAGFYTLTMNLGIGTTPFTFFINNDTVAAGFHAAIGHVQPLINVELFGDMKDRDFFVDDLPDFAPGLILQGVWGNPHSNQADWRRERLPQPSTYRWRWVLNADGFGDVQGAQDPGVLLQIGSWGDVTGEGWDASRPWTGLRIPVRTLWQVERMEFDPPELVFSEPVFFDDPFLLGDASEGWRFENWTRGVLRENTLVVHYRGGPGVTPPTPRRFPFADFTNLVTTDPMDPTWGIWSAPTILFHTGQASDTNDFSDGLGERRPSAHEQPGHVDFGWSNWLINANQRITIRYRSAPPITVRIPVYNALASIEVTSANPVVLNGFGAVDVRPEGQTEFLRQVVITGTYTQNLGGAPVQRDILASQAAGRLRGDIMPAGTSANTVPVNATGGIIGVNGSVETAGVNNIGANVAVATNIHGAGASASDWMNPNIFTQRNSTAFFDTGATRNVRVEVQPQLLGTNATTQSRTSRNANFPIGMVNYTFVPGN